MATANTYVNVKRVFNTQPEVPPRRPRAAFNSTWRPRTSMHAPQSLDVRRRAARRRRSWASSSTSARS